MLICFSFVVQADKTRCGSTLQKLSRLKIPCWLGQQGVSFAWLAFGTTSASSRKSLSLKREKHFIKSRISVPLSLFFVCVFAFFHPPFMNNMFIKLSSQLNSYLETKLLQSEKKQLFISSNDMWDIQCTKCFVM